MREKKYFLTQDKGENILKIVHKHPFTLFRDMFIAIIIFIISLVVMLCYFYYSVWYVFIVVFIFFIFSIISGLYSFFVWDRDIYIITDKRLIDIEQKSLFSKTQKDTAYDKIQDISIEINGILGSIFKYGNLLIQTASDSSLTFSAVYDPGSIQKIITGRINESKDGSGPDIRSEESAVETLKTMIKEAIQEEKQNKVEEH